MRQVDRQTVLSHTRVPHAGYHQPIDHLAPEAAPHLAEAYFEARDKRRAGQAFMWRKKLIRRTAMCGLAIVVGVMAFAYAGLMGVFLCVLLTGRGSTPSVIGALVAGSAVIAVSRYVPVIADWGLAWPYWMVLGTLASLGVCLLGKTPRLGGL